MSVSTASRIDLRTHRHRIRSLRNRLVDQQLRQLEQLRRRVLQGVDVVVLGDSSCLFGAPGDPDPAMIPELIGRELGGASVATIAGPGYSARMHAEVLRILGTLDRRPEFVVSSICVRTNISIHVTRHPVYEYAHSLAEMAGITSVSRRIRSLGRGYQPTEEDYERFRALPVRTRWSGDTTIGAFRNQLQGLGPHPWPPDKERLLFDYFHGELFSPETPGLVHLRELGHRFKDYGVPAVSYLTAVPLERGEHNYPGEFAQLARANVSLVADTIAADAEPVWQLVDASLVDNDYVDSQDGVEHFALSGRLKIARAVATALRP